MDSMAIIGDKTKHKNIPNEDGSNLCVCCKRYNLHYSKKYNINASNRDAYVAAFNFEVPIGVCCNSCYNKQYRFNKNNQHDETLSSTENNHNTENSKNKRKRNNSTRKSSIASSSGSSSRSREEEEDETLRIADGEEASSNTSPTSLVKRSSNCSSSSSENNDDEVSPSSSKKRKRSLTSLVTTTNTTTIVDQNANPTESQNSQNDLLTPWNALSNQDDEFLHLLDSIPNNNYVKHQVVETLLPQIPHQPPTHYNQHVNNQQLHHQQHSLQSLLNEMATNNANTSNLINNSTSNLPFSNMMLYNQHQYHLNSSSPSKPSSVDQSFVEMVLGQDTASTNQMLNSLDINELAMKRMKGNQTNHQLGMSNAQLSTSNSSITSNEMVQPFCILDSNTTASTTSSSTTPTVMTTNLSNPQMFNMSPSSAPFLSQFFSTIPSSQPQPPQQQQYSFAVTPQVSPNGTAQAAMFVIFFDDSRILTFADYSHYENSLMTSKFSIHKCCTFSYLCEQLSEKMVNEKKLWNINMLKSITQIKLKRSGVLTPLDPYTTPQLQFEHGDVLLVHLV